MPITLTEVAARARVSRMTASRALNGGTVAPETRSRVLAAATVLGYRPNLLGRALGRGRLTVLGVLVRDLVNSFYAPIIQAVHGVARDHGYLVAVSESARDLAQERQWAEHAAQMRFAGVIVTPTSTRTEHLRQMADGGTPVVVTARRWPDGDYVTADHRLGGWMATRHLLDLGHRRVACVYLQEPEHTAMGERVEGYQAALREVGVQPHAPLAIAVRAFEAEEGARAADRLLALRQRPTAVFAGADALAVGLLARLRERSVAVPEEMAVVGYDDIPHARYLEVPLTTVALPKEEMGRRAAEIVFERLAGNNARTQQITLLPELVVRASSGAAGRGITTPKG